MLTVDMMISVNSDDIISDTIFSPKRSLFPEFIPGELIAFRYKLELP